MHMILLKRVRDCPLPLTLSLDLYVIAEVNHRYRHGTSLAAEL